MLTVGITGGIGTGKSTVSRIFSILKIPVYEADSRAKILIEEDKVIVAAIKNLLGKEAYLREGKYNKTYVAQRVFSNPEILKKLNGIVHPAVQKDFSVWVEKQTTPYIIKEAAIMSRNSGLDKIIVVTSPLQLRISRIMLRDKRTAEQIENIIENQKSEEQFLEMADFEIKNNEEEFLVTQVLEIDKILKKGL